MKIDGELLNPKLMEIRQEQIRELGYDPNARKFKWFSFLLGSLLLALCIFILLDPKFTANNINTYTDFRSTLINYADTVWSPIFAVFAMLFAIFFVAWGFVAFPRTFLIVLGVLLGVFAYFAFAYPEIIQAATSTFVTGGVSGKAGFVLSVLLSIWSPKGAYVIWTIAGLCILAGLVVKTHELETN